MATARTAFIWEDEPSGDVVIGNAQAFAEHLQHRFNIDLGRTGYQAIHELMRALGEVLGRWKHDGSSQGRTTHHQLPQVRVIKRGER